MHTAPHSEERERERERRDGGKGGGEQPGRARLLPDASVYREQRDIITMLAIILVKRTELSTPVRHHQTTPLLKIKILRLSTLEAERRKHAHLSLGRSLVYGGDVSVMWSEWKVRDR